LGTNKRFTDVSDNCSPRSTTAFHGNDTATLTEFFGGERGRKRMRGKGGRRRNDDGIRRRGGGVGR
jgi:hypothetical protein